MMIFCVYIVKGLIMRQKSHDLQYLETLYRRNGLTKLEENEYWKLLKGYQGEVQFDKLIIGKNKLIYLYKRSFLC